MKSEKVTFTNENGLELAGRLELPPNRHPEATAILAHCFTCGKDLKALRNVSRTLAVNGIAVLRFDFAGIGESEGEFEDKTFSTNVEDILSAARFLEKEYKAPTLLIGHSLGGAAVILAAEKLKAVKAVATIGAPANPNHVQQLQKNNLSEIEEKGSAEVQLGLQKFRISDKFIRDISGHHVEQVLRQLRKSILVMHSPQDEIVGIENASQIFEAAFHPKSFVSLDGADHLLSETKDSIYVGDVIAAWAARYLDLPDEDEPLGTDKQVVVRTGDEGYTTEIQAGNHSLVADEPVKLGGNDFGPTPYDLLVAGLGACTSITLRMYADRKKWDLDEVLVHLQHSKIHAEDCEGCEDEGSKIDTITRSIELKGNLTEEQRQRLLQIAEKCPVHRTLTSDIKIETQLK